MQINNLLFNYIKQNIPKEILRENSILEGEILDIVDNTILINIAGKGIVEAESQVDLSKYLGKDIKFLIESETDKLIEIKPIVEELIQAPEIQRDESVNRILKHFNIKETEITKDLIESLMKYELPLKEEVINEAVKTLEKLVQLIDLEDENLELIINKNIENSLETEDVEEVELVKDDFISKKELKNDKIDKNIDIKEGLFNKNDEDNNISDNLNKFKNLFDKLEPMEKEIDIDIKNIIMTSEEVVDSKLNETVKEFLVDFDLEFDSKDIIEIVTFLTKNKIKPSLNNIKNLKEIIDDPAKFMEDIKKLDDILSKEISTKEKENLFIKDIKDSVVNSDKKIINNGEELKEIEKKLDFKSEYKKELLDIRNKSEFIKEMNNDMYYHMIPINYGEKELEGYINIMKEKKSRNKKDGKINIFINLDTNTLGNIKVSCQSYDENLSIKIGMNEEDKRLFEAGKDVLVDRIENLGYKVKNIVFMEYEDVNILESINDEKDPLHFLDIKV